MCAFRQPTRRQFLHLAGAATVLARTAGAALAEEPAKPVSPNDRIRIALLGAGGMGQGDTETALEVPGVELVAAADIYDGRFEECRKKLGKDLQTTRDYREVLARKDVGAVIVGSPDHWHMPMTVDALEAGKDVYCEKPMMHSVDEGVRMLEAQKREPSKETALSDATRHRFADPDGYDDRLGHFRSFFASVRSRRPVVEDALFGLRAAAPSLLCNLSYDKARPVGWDPETFKVTAA